jgi:hypothetical protein
MKFTLIDKVLKYFSSLGTFCAKALADQRLGTFLFQFFILQQHRVFFIFVYLLFDNNNLSKLYLIIIIIIFIIKQRNEGI